MGCKSVNDGFRWCKERIGELERENAKLKESLSEIVSHSEKMGQSSGIRDKARAIPKSDNDVQL